MKYNVLTIPPFEKQLKRLVKKYPSLKSEFEELVKLLEKDPTHGIHLFKNCYKIRLSIASKGKGKSGGARIITNFIVEEGNVYLLSLFDKSEKATMSDKEIIELLGYLID